MTDTALDYWAAGGYIPKEKRTAPGKPEKKRRREALKKSIVKQYQARHPELSKGEIRKLGRNIGYDNLLKQNK